jgi:hypothetical protein
MTYRPDTKKVYIILRQEAGTKDYLKAAFAAHTYLWLLDDLEGTAAAAAAAGPGAGAAKQPFLPFPWLMGRTLDEAATPLLADAPPSSSASSSSSSSRKEQQQQQQQQQQPKKKKAAAAGGGGSGGAGSGSQEPWQHAMEQSISRTDAMFGDFLRQAEKQGWKLQATMLNPREVRLLKLGNMG